MLYKTRRAHERAHILAFVYPLQLLEIDTRNFFVFFSSLLLNANGISFSVDGIFTCKCSQTAIVRPAFRCHSIDCHSNLSGHTTAKMLILSYGNRECWYNVIFVQWKRKIDGAVATTAAAAAVHLNRSLWNDFRRKTKHWKPKWFLFYTQNTFFLFIIWFDLRFKYMFFVSEFRYFAFFVVVVLFLSSLISITSCFIDT